MEDRIEAGTFLILGAIHNGITIYNIHPQNITYLTDVLYNCGYSLEINDNNITLQKYGEMYRSDDREAQARMVAYISKCTGYSFTDIYDKY